MIESDDFSNVVFEHKHYNFFPRISGHLSVSLVRKENKYEMLLLCFFCRRLIRTDIN